MCDATIWAAFSALAILASWVVREARSTCGGIMQLPRGHGVWRSGWWWKCGETGMGAVRTCVFNWMCHKDRGWVADEDVGASYLACS